jgi:hypothetical protein
MHEARRPLDLLEGCPLKLIGKNRLDTTNLADELSDASPVHGHGRGNIRKVSTVGKLMERPLQRPLHRRLYKPGCPRRHSSRRLNSGLAQAHDPTARSRVFKALPTWTGARCTERVGADLTPQLKGQRLF